MKKYLNFLIYGCFSKEEFELVKDLREQFNYNMWRILSVFLTVYCLFLAGSTLFIDDVTDNAILYLVMTLITSLCALMFWTVLKKNKRLMIPVIHLLNSCLLCMGIMVGGVFSPEFPATTLHVIMIAIPLALVDHPFRIGLIELAATIVMIILCLSTETGRVQSFDVSNAIFFGVLDQFVVYLMTASRMNQLLVTRRAEIASVTDEMTGLLNRKAFEQDVLKCPELPDRESVVLIAMDANGLKKANDTKGHLAGDELLIGAAEAMKRVFSAHGKVYRVGGDEFVALIRVKKNELEMIRAEFETVVSAWKEALVDRLSISAGYVVASEFPEFTTEELVQLADSRMYQAKSQYYIENGLDRRRR